VLTRAALRPGDHQPAGEHAEQPGGGRAEEDRKRHRDGGQHGRQGGQGEPGEGADSARVPGAAAVRHPDGVGARQERVRQRGVAEHRPRDGVARRPGGGGGRRHQEQRQRARHGDRIRRGRPRDHRHARHEGEGAGAERDPAGIAAHPPARAAVHPGDLVGDVIDEHLRQFLDPWP